MIVINLTPDEIAVCETIGLKRESLRRARGRSVDFSRFDRGGSNDRRNIIGCIGEYAVAKWAGVLDDWLANRAYSEHHWTIDSDIAGGLHVRATPLKHGGLILHPYDTAGPYILCVVDEAVTLVGWIHSEEARLPQYWRDYGPGFSIRPAYLIPQSSLYPMDLLCPVNSSSA